MYHLGIDIGGTFIKYALVDESYKIVKKWKKPSILMKTKDDFYQYLCEDVDVSEVDFIGVSAPGVVNDDSTIMSKAAPNVRIMYQTNVNEEIGSRLNRPVATMNDAKAAGFCELKIGHGKGTKSSVYYIIGTGIGGCVCNESGVIQGVDNVAGEFSGLPIGRDADGRYIGLSQIGAITSLIDIYNREAAVPLTYGTEVTEKYLKDDPVAIKAMEEWCKNILFGLHMIIIFYNPEVICLGGGISEEDWFIEKMQKMFKEDQSSHNFNGLITTRIERCKYNNDANILGAMLYAESCFKQER